MGNSKPSEAAVSAGQESRASAAAHAALVAFLLVAMLLKMFALILSRVRFGGTPGVVDAGFALGGDLLLACAGLIAAGLLRRFIRTPSPMRRFGAVAGLWMLCALTGLAALWLVVSAYSFWLQGQFLEREQLGLAWASRDALGPSMRYLILAPAALGAGALAIAGMSVAAVSYARFRQRALPGTATGWRFVMATVVIGGLDPALRPFEYDPAVPSPILLLGRPTVVHGDAMLPAEQRPNGTYTAPTDYVATPPGLAGLAGSARGQDLILVVLESVRHANVSLYGYGRPTTPHLERLATESIVFHRAYSFSPLSLKTLESVLFGIDPPVALGRWARDPREQPGVANLLGVMRARGDALYFAGGGAGHAEYGDILRAAAGGPLERSVMDGDFRRGREDRPPDLAPVEDFLSWVGERPLDRPVTAVLWLPAAHHPYETSHKPFREGRRIDAYDNCIASADLAVGRLVEGLEQSQRRAVVAIFGDHGEAFGEHMGDAFRGRYLYDTTVRVPFVVYAPAVLAERVDVRARFTLKDLPATLLWLLGIEARIGVSRPAFTRSDSARTYLSTIFGDLKLAVIDEQDRKLVYRPERRRAYLYDLRSDPDERVDLAPVAPHLVKTLLDDLLRWSFWHQDNLNQLPAEPARPGAPH